MNLKDKYTDRLSYYIYAPIILIYGLFLAIYSQGGFPEINSSYFFMPYVSDKIIGEDGYYMLSVAWNIASGHGISYNFSEPTTGVQPLATFLYAALAKIVQILEYDKFTFARLTFFFNTILFIYFAHLMGKLSTVIVKTDKKLIYLISFLTTLSNIVIWKHFTYGLETGLYLVLFSILIIFQLKNPIDKFKNMVIFGILIGITGLARIDFGIIFFIFFIFKVISDRKSIVPLMVSGVIAIIIVSPWFFYVYYVTGNLIPSSGGAQASIITSFNVGISRIFKMLIGISDNSISFIYYGGKTILGVMLLSVMSIYIYLVKRFNIFVNIRQDYKYWLYGVITIIVIYTIMFWASHFYARYSSPIIIFTIPIFSILISKLIKDVKLWVHLSFFILFIWLFLVYHRGAINNPHSVSSGFIKENYPNKTIGAFQSGVVGYFNSNVYNLDGKLDYESLKYLKKGNIHKVIEQKNIDIIIDWESYIRNIDDNYLQNNFILIEKLPNDSYVYKRR